MLNTPKISEAFDAIDVLADFVNGVQQLSEQIVGIQSVTKKHLVPTQKTRGRDVIIDDDMPDNRIDFLLDDVVCSSIHFDEHLQIPNYHMGMDGKLKIRDE